MADKSKFTGRWHYDYRKATVELREDGFAEMSWPDKTAYKGKWYLPDDKHLVLLIVVPLNRPDIDDELNAEEMYYTLQEVTADKIVAEQLDEEGILKRAMQHKLSELPAAPAAPFNHALQRTAAGTVSSPRTAGLSSRSVPPSLSLGRSAAAHHH